MSFDNCICTVDCPLTEDKHYINCPAHTYYNEAYFRPALEASSRQEERLRLALQPFVAHWQPWMDGAHWSDDDDMSTFARVTYGDLRRARAALEPPHAKDAADV